MTAPGQDILLSFIVPCYKVERYLPKCLDSLLAQTLDQIEIICINDGSPDNCLGILREYQRRHSDKIVVIDKENEGTWRGRWDGIAVARGEYIGFLDGDDYAEPDLAETLYQTARTADADIAVCGFERTELGTGRVLSRELCGASPSFSIERDPGRLVGLNTAPWNKCFRASVLKSMRDLDNPPSVAEDVAFHLLAYLDMRGVVAFAPRPLVHYMVRSDSAMNSMGMAQVRPVLDAFLEIRRHYEAGRPELLPMLDLMAFLHLGVSFVFRLSCDPTNDIRGVIDEMTRYLDEFFPSWSRSPYLRLSYVRNAGGAFRKLWLAQGLYRAGLMPVSLSAYRFLISRLGIDIKW